MTGSDIGSEDGGGQHPPAARRGVPEAEVIREGAHRIASAYRVRDERERRRRGNTMWSRSPPADTFVCSSGWRYRSSGRSRNAGCAVSGRMVRKPFRSSVGTASVACSRAMTAITESVKSSASSRYLR